MPTRVRRIVLFCAALLILGSSAPAGAQTAGQVDPTFDAGIVDSGFGSSSIRAVALQPDGKILVGGFFTTVGGVSRHGIARLNADGSVDGTFAAPFFVNRRIPIVHAIVVQPDGKILIGGEGFNVGTTDYFLARLLPDGSLDPGFLLIQTNATAGIDTITLLPDGRFYIGGDHGNIGAIQTRTVTRMQADGSVDTSFAIQSLDYSGRALSIVVEPDGSIIAGGNFSGHTLGGGVLFGSLARFSSTGVVDSTFDPGFDLNNPPSVESVLRRGDGTIYAAGLFRSLHGSSVHGLVRLNPTTGARIAAFDPMVHPTTDDFRAIAFDLEGRLLATGSFYLPGTGPTDERRQIARLDADTGAFDGFYPPNGIEMGGSGFALAVQPDAKVLVVGDFAQLGGAARSRIARLLDVVNTPPVAVDDTYTATVNLPLTVPAPGVLGNDSDADGDPLSAVLVAPPASGTLALAGDGSFTYTPTPGFAGNDSFTYVAYDGHDTSIAATVHIAVLAPVFISAGTGGTIPGGGGIFTGFPGAPGISGGVSAFLATGSTGLQGVFGCDRFMPGDPCRPLATTATAIPGGSGLFTGFSSLSVAPGATAFIGGGTGGQLGVFACDTFIPTDPCQPVVSLATPIPGGTGLFTNFLETAIATTAAQAPPPIAVLGSGASGQLGIFGCVAFTPGDPCTPIVTNATAIPGGSGAVTGFRSLALTLDPGRSNPTPTVAFIGVGPAGQQGVYRCQPGDPCQPIATTATAIPGGTGAFNGFSQVASGGRFTTFIATGAGQAGVYACDLGAIPTEPCRPVANLTSPIPGGTGAFTGFSAVSTALGHTAFLAQGANGQAGIYVASVPQKVVAVGDVIAGKTIASLTFGRDGFDGSHVAFGARFTDQSEGVFVADVAFPANHVPVAGDDHTSTLEDTPVTLDVVSNDTDADAEDALAIGGVTAPAHGVATIVYPRRIAYTPAANYNGPDAFTYTVYDGHGGSDTAVVTVSVGAVNDAPVAVADSYATPEDTILNIIAPGVLLNDGDVDGPSLTAELVTNAAHGVVNMGASGAFVYTPATNYNGPDAFTYRVSDGLLLSNIVTVSITVTPVNDPPVAVNDGYTTAANTPITVAAPGVLGNDSDPEGSALTAVLVTTPALGTLVFNANGGFTFTPASNSPATVAFTYRASDGNATSALTTVSIAVTGTPPVTGWLLTGSLRVTGAGPQGRTGHTATLLANGKVLVVGGVGANPDVPRSAQLYDPATGAWATLPHLPVARAGHTATLLPNGKVLIAGGFRLLGSASPVGLLDGCFLFDPAANTWAPTDSFLPGSAGPTARALHTATLLPNGKVLVVGGVGSNPVTPQDAQLYDPATGHWSRTAGLVLGFGGRAGHTAALLADGRVLVAGGLRILGSAVPVGFLETAAIYTPATGTWAATGSFRVTAGGPQGRAAHSATLLPSGKVLVVGGAGGSTDVPRLPQIFDPATGAWSFAAGTVHGRMQHTATLLTDGKVLVAGGQDVGSAAPLGTLATSQLYDPATNTWTAAASLNIARSGHTATLLPTGEVLAVAGLGANGALTDTVERYVR